MALTSGRRRALLLQFLGPKGQRIFDALPAPPPRHPPLSSGTTDTRLTEGAKDGTQLTADATIASPPDLYDVVVNTLTKHFTANVRVERHHFREGCPLPGESVADFALALRELAAPCNFAATADDNLSEQFIAVVVCPQLRRRLLLEGDALTFDRAVEIAQLREQSPQESEALVNPVHRIAQQQLYAHATPLGNIVAALASTGPAPLVSIDAARRPRSPLPTRCIANLPIPAVTAAQQDANDRAASRAATSGSVTDASATSNKFVETLIAANDEGRPQSVNSIATMTPEASLAF